MTALLYAAAALEIGVCVAASRLWFWGMEGPRPDRRDLPGGPWCWPAPG